MKLERVTLDLGKMVVNTEAAYREKNGLHLDRKIKDIYTELL